ncbi:MAG: NAD-dependent epimerase/dehydratase family protein [Candidatus Marinimicrobia bacterium]|nr:NAD-dependent epimerase/dehydratase family protein [Candidatus Neomarinimicrobiota bacterium]
MRILVTGGAGFIGSHLAERFTGEGHEIVILDNLSTGFESNVPENVNFVKGDIGDKELVARLFREYHFEVLSHHAAQMNVRHSVEDPSFDAKENILGTLNLLQTGMEYGLKKVMFASTGGAIYGEQTAFPATEEHPTNPIAPYGVSKLACEKYLNYYTVEHGLKTIVMRYANVYGPRQNPYGEAGVVAIFSRLLASGEQVTINGDGKQTRDYMFVGDLVEANLAGLDYTDSLTINLGTGLETDVVQLYQYLAEAAGTSLEPQFGAAKPGEQRRSVISPEKARRVLGWQPRIELAEGLEKTYKSFAA